MHMCRTQVVNPHLTPTLRLPLCSPECPGTHSADQAALRFRNPPASDFRVLGLKACVTTTLRLSTLTKGDSLPAKSSHQPKTSLSHATLFVSGWPDPTDLRSLPGIFLSPPSAPSPSAAPRSSCPRTFAGMSPALPPLSHLAHLSGTRRYTSWCVHVHITLSRHP